jgi:uncharacterized protein DUF6093
MPLDGTHVVHPRWSEHHRPTATATMTAECVITRPAAPGTTGTTGTWTPPPDTTVYTGPCRLVPKSTDQGRHQVVGDTQVTPRSYHVGIEYDTAEILIGDIVEITAAKDPGLAGHKLRVIDVQYGSEQWQRDLLTQEIQR